MLMAALETEAADYVERHCDERDEEGRALVVHNDRFQGRKLTLGRGTVELRTPRVNDNRRRDEQGQRQRFSSRILPPYMRRSPKVAELLPILYLRGRSTGDFLREIISLAPNTLLPLSSLSGNQFASECPSRARPSPDVRTNTPHCSPR